MENNTIDDEAIFLTTYGNRPVYFRKIEDYRVLYSNEYIWCSGKIDYRDKLFDRQTVMDIFNLEDFKFGFNN